MGGWPLRVYDFVLPIFYRVFVFVSVKFQKPLLYSLFSILYVSLPFFFSLPLSPSSSVSILHELGSASCSSSHFEPRPSQFVFFFSLYVSLLFFSLLFLSFPPVFQILLLHGSCDECIYRGENMHCVLCGCVWQRGRGMRCREPLQCVSCTVQVQET